MIVETNFTCVRELVNDGDKNKLLEHYEKQSKVCLKKHYLVETKVITT